MDSSILAALVKLGTDTHTPIGIVLDVNKPEQLCQQYRQITVLDRPISAFLHELLSRSDYSWAANGGVIVVQPISLSHDASQVLSMKFDKFGAMQTTMQGLRINLAGWIYSRLHPEAGFAGNILSSPDAEQFPMDVRDASVEQILNQIVSLGSKGIWLFRLRRDFEHSKDVDLRTYSYKDDSRVLQGICKIF